MFHHGPVELLHMTLPVLLFKHANFLNHAKFLTQECLGQYHRPIIQHMKNVFTNMKDLIKWNFAYKIFSVFILKRWPLFTKHIIDVLTAKVGKKNGHNGVFCYIIEICLHYSYFNFLFISSNNSINLLLVFRSPKHSL